LQENGYHTIESVAMGLKKNLVAINGIGETKAEKMIKEAQKYGKKNFKDMSWI
jgi:ribosomal protein S13